MAKALAGFSRWRESTRRWIVDSGSAFDIISKGEITVEETQSLKLMDESLWIITANGELEASETCEIYMPWSKNNIKATVLETSTPSLLSLGKRCMLHGRGIRIPLGTIQAP